MKKILTISVIFLFVIIAVGLLYIYMAYPSVGAPSAVTVQVTPERIERGAYLAQHVVGCVDCHSSRDWRYYAGPIVKGTEGRGGERFGEELGMPGTLYAPNITPAAIANWTDGDLIRAITAGVNKSGKPLFPLMPYLNFGQLSQEDIYSVVAYLRSLPAIKNNIPDRSLNFPMNLIVRTIPQSAHMQAVPDTSDEVAYGRYVITAAGCGECHTPMDQGKPIPGKEYAGGREFKFPDGSIVRSANITPDKETGIGEWSKEFFLDQFKQYDKPEGLTIPAEPGKNTLMPWTFYAGMKEKDLAAVYSYLHSLPAVSQQVERYSKPM